MHKRFFYCFLICYTTLCQAYSRGQDLEKPPFQKGEYLEYNVYYSFVHAGTAIMQVDQDLHHIANQSCYKLHVKGVSNNALKLFGMSVCNSWESYLDVKQLRPVQFFSHIQENNYTREEHICFDYQTNEATIRASDSDNKMESKTSSCPITHTVKDFVSGYYALRNIDVNKLKTGDKLSLDILHENQVYQNIEIAFLGKAILATKLGKIATLVFAPMVPTDHTIFSGERPVEVFISDDENKIPIKLKANLVIGGVEIELTNYKGLRADIVVQKT